MISRQLSALICLLLPMAALADPQPATAPAPIPPAPPALLPAPDASSQAKARDMIHAIYKEDFTKTTPAARTALARRLLAEAAATKDDAAARYVLLSDSADMAAGAGDAQTAVQAVSDLALLYAVDSIELQKTALLRASTAITTPESAEILSRLCLDAADAASRADAFDTVQQLANVAEAAANKTRKVALVASIQVHLADLRALAAEYTKARQALDQLAKKPDDPAAHTVLGKFYALHKGQWDVGLPHLAAGTDADLRALAARDLAAPADGLEQTALGDAWWDFSEKAAGLTRTQSAQHALAWYRRAEKSLSGITLARIQSRLHAGVANGQTARVGPKTTAPAAAGIDLLALIDPAKDAAEGKWSVDAGTLVVASGKYSTLQLPYNLPEEYDLRVAFTRTEGEGPVNLLLAAHKKAFGLALDVKGEARLERVGNKIARDNPTSAPVVVSNNHKYTVTVQVRKDSVRALLDDKQIIEWKTDFKDLSRYVLWKLPDEKLCGLGANAAKVTFHSIELIEITGNGKPLR